MKLKFAVSIALVALVALVFVVPVMALPAGEPVARPVYSRLFTVTPGQMAEILLGVVGVALSLAFKYVPKWKDWFDNFQHQGLVMLAFVVITGGVYFGLACSPYAALLGIQIACELASVFVLLKAIFIVAMANQLTYLFTPEPKPRFPEFG